MNNIWTLVVTSCDDGENIYTIADGVFSSEERAMRELAEWCKGQWMDQKSDLVDEEEPLEGTDIEVVQKYFGFWSPEEQYSIEEREVDKEL